MKSNAPEPSKGFGGMMLGATLQDIIQMECLLLTTRAVRVETGKDTGRIYFAGGQIVHASVGLLRGEDAFMEILSWRNGNFSIEENVRSTEETITRHWQGLLLDAAQRNDETNAAIRNENNTVIQLDPAKALPLKPIQEINASSEVLICVQYAEDGTLLESKGDDPENFQAGFAYVLQLIKLVGTSLGAENIREVEFQSRQNKGLCLVNETATTCFVTTSRANLSLMAKKLNAAPAQ